MFKVKIYFMHTVEQSNFQTQILYSKLFQPVSSPHDDLCPVQMKTSAMLIVIHLSVAEV